MAESAPTGTEEERAKGQARQGCVDLRSFDEGVVTTLGGVVIGSNYFLPKADLLPVEPTPGMPGIPIVFSHPEDLFERYKLPVIVVRRDDLTPAMNRWHPSHFTYRTAAKDASPVSVEIGTPGTTTAQTVHGFDKYEEQQMAVPYDITYSVNIMARHRGYGPARKTPTGTGSPRTQVNSLLNYVLRIYPPYCTVVVKDSIGDQRSYHAFQDAISHLDEVASVTERVLGFALTLRVEAELDLHDPVTRMAVTGQAEIESETL